MSRNYIGISAIEVVLPKGKMTINDMALQAGVNACELEHAIGVSEKPVVGSCENITELAVTAAYQLITKNKIDVSNIDFIVHGSCGLQDKQLWSIAAKIQKEIGASNAFAFDLQNGCNSGNLALDIASKFLLADDSKNEALIIISDELSNIVNYADPVHQCIFNFSDAACAVWIRKDESRNKVLTSVFTTEAIFADSMFKNVNEQHVWLNDDPEEDKRLIMEYEKRYIQVITEGLEKVNKKISDVSHIVMNQGDHKLIKKLSNRLLFPIDRMFRSHNQYGHLGGTDIFLGLNHVLNKARKGDLVVLASSAIGFSWGASIIEI